MTGNWKYCNHWGKKVSILTCWLPYFQLGMGKMGHADQYATNVGSNLSTTFPVRAFDRLMIRIRSRNGGLYDQHEEYYWRA